MIGEKLIYLRKKHKYTQVDIAKKLSITSSSYGDYERNISRPTFEALIKLSNIFNVSIDYLIGNEINGESKIIFSKEEVTKILNVVEIINQKLK